MKTIHLKRLFLLSVVNIVGYLLVLNFDILETDTREEEHEINTSRILATTGSRKTNLSDDVNSTSASPEKSLLTPSSTRQRDTVAICAIQKGSLPFIDEWIDYNLAIGFDKIYIYDNSPDFELQEWYENRNKTYIDITHFPGEVKQKAAYQACISKIKWEMDEKPKHTWIAFIDVDEYIVLKKHDHIIDLLEDTTKVSNVGGLALNWYMFGFHNQIKYKPLPLTKRFQMREKGTNQHVKVIVRTDMMGNGGGMRNPHCYRYSNNSIATVDTNGKRLIEEPWFNVDGPSDVAVIHHYYTKSLEEYVSRCGRGRAGQKQNKAKDPSCRSEEEILEEWQREMKESVFDDSAWQVLKTRVSKYAKYDEIISAE
ncbi:hypothetical protein CTEN210_12896 [Chaetoceros tenuissimus]|uniref:Glycosyltransferase family 92 protein n=1 Tax=Chaetoceros tenuissimus TaxID=426638 RepID=A0AAD3HAI3_9STRA|nr:hypothetical protein CTEN210_12896 [Chaetoceros tenuissimus]